VLETPGLPVQLDGDYAGETPMRFSVDAGALAVSIPASAQPDILAA
jgi:diacylglycerol kinase family enzyme